MLTKSVIGEPKQHISFLLSDCVKKMYIFQTFDQTKMRFCIIQKKKKINSEFAVKETEFVTCEIYFWFIFYEKKKTKNYHFVGMKYLSRYAYDIE